jgi:tRNA (guanine37-N1)-methyltransferase
LVCGHYEGIDERVNKYVTELVSIGDFILTGGEIPAMAVSDSVIRLLEGAIEAESLHEESFDNNLLEYPQYTEPYNFEGKLVPSILYSGNHQAISKWRLKESIKLTWIYRPDLWSRHASSKQEKALIKEIEEKEVGQWELDAIEKGKKFMKTED